MRTLVARVRERSAALSAPNRFLQYRPEQIPGGVDDAGRDRTRHLFQRIAEKFRAERRTLGRGRKPALTRFIDLEAERRNKFADRVSHRSPSPPHIDP
jgi:hypothetical protein